MSEDSGGCGRARIFWKVVEIAGWIAVGFIVAFFGLVSHEIQALVVRIV